MSVHHLPSHVKRKGQSTSQGPYHPDILADLRRLWMALDPATARQRVGVQLLSLGLELLELDAEPELYRSEVADLEAHLAALEELAAIGPHVVAAYKRAHAADRELVHWHALKDELIRALYPEQPLGMRERLREIEGSALRVFAALEAIDAAEHEQQPHAARAPDRDRPWDRDIWCHRASGLLSRAAAALQDNRPSTLNVLKAVGRWLEVELRTVPTWLEDQAAEQRARRAHDAAIKRGLEELAAVASAALEELAASAPDPDRSLELAANGGDA